MVKIRPISFLFPIDENGFIRNPFSIDDIPVAFQSPLELIIETYQKEFGAQLHSIYLRGSVLRGTYQNGISDLDVFAVIQSPSSIKWSPSIYQATVNTQLQRAYDFIDTVEMRFCSFQTDFNKEHPRLAIVKDLHSVCIYGTSLITSLPIYRPNHEVCLNHHWLESDINTVLEHIKTQNIDKPVIRMMLKTLIRTGFELTITRSKIYTLDLYPCVKTFSEYYPDYQNDMTQALHWYLNEDYEIPKLEDYLYNFGKYMNEEVKTMFKGS